MPQAEALVDAGLETGRCYACFRPRRDCFCADIPAIDNRTEVLILQHIRERFHPFNTARLVRRALGRSQLVSDHIVSLAARLTLQSGAGLLYPGSEALLLAELPADERPTQLVVLDGTWHHTKTLLRDIPALRALPRYRLAPAAPSRFRIRREPHAAALSTVEAVVAALRVLEPDTVGLELLIAAFDRMVERQLAHPKAEYGWRRNERRNQTVGNIPTALLGDLGNVVAAYGESTPGRRGDRRAARAPVVWAAERLGTGERFTCLIRPETPPTDACLRHWELTRADFANALSLDEVRTAWAAFQRRDDILTVYNAGSARLLGELAPQALPNVAPCLVLKSVDLPSLRTYATLDDLVAGENLSPAPAPTPGRAGRRLVNLAALVRYLRTVQAE